VRLGSMHRNTFINTPRLLNAELALRSEPRLHFAGQITGVEGYMESAAMGLYVGRRVALALLGRQAPLPSPRTMTGALLHYVCNAQAEHFQPMNANLGLLEPAGPEVNKSQRKAFFHQRALAEAQTWATWDAL